jgi:hypothetical protein
MHYDRDGREISQAEWSELFALGLSYRRIAYDEATGVSTVWLGIDYSFGDGPPLIFETLGHDGDVQRWPNEVAALAGHDQAVAQALEAMRRR